MTSPAQSSLIIPRVLLEVVVEGDPATKKTTQRPIFPALNRWRGLNNFFRHLADVAEKGADRSVLVEQLRWAADRAKPIILPSDVYEKYSKIAIPQLRAAWRRAGNPSPFEGEVWVEATFYRRSYVGRPDLHAMQEALADLLEEKRGAGVIGNDYQIVSWDGTRRSKDPKRPRTEIVIREVEA